MRSRSKRLQGLLMFPGGHRDARLRGSVEADWIDRMGVCGPVGFAALFLTSSLSRKPQGEGP